MKFPMSLRGKKKNQNQNQNHHASESALGQGPRDFHSSGGESTDQPHLGLKLPLLRADGSTRRLQTSLLTQIKGCKVALGVGDTAVSRGIAGMCQAWSTLTSRLHLLKRRLPCGIRSQTGVGKLQKSPQKLGIVESQDRLRLGRITRDCLVQQPAQAESAREISQDHIQLGFEDVVLGPPATALPSSTNLGIVLLWWVNRG